MNDRSLLRVTGQVGPLSPGVFALVVPGCSEKEAHGCSLVHVGRPRDGDRASRNDTVGVVDLGELVRRVDYLRFR